ncbi:MAG: hypothetical protein CMB82_10520 [Flammeovirgaceae bacterium]|nr:hypothetical protein [Flammeovirgaceae bacterium]|tara:strand:+ start:406 stop:1287 length:882 start_codon:yes stop_codon:yes gene_type:complete
MKLTAHSEFGKIHSLMIKPVAAAFQSESRLASQWKALNYLSQPNFKNSTNEYEHFRKIIEDTHPLIYELPRKKNIQIDSIYCRDASVSTNEGMIICNMGKVARANEPVHQKQVFEQLGIGILGEIKSPGTLEGGDVAWLNETTLAVGHTYRTNYEGIKQLRNLLKPLNIHVIVVEMPHYNGPNDVFHLMSVLSPIDKDLAVIYPRLIPIYFRNELIRRNFKLIDVPDQEFDTMGCNVLALAPRKVLMVNGNPITQELLRVAGVEVFNYAGKDISIKGGGGPTCLTRPVMREIQ